MCCVLPAPCSSFHVRDERLTPIDSSYCHRCRQKYYTLRLKTGTIPRTITCIEHYFRIGKKRETEREILCVYFTTQFTTADPLRSWSTSFEEGRLEERCCIQFKTFVSEYRSALLYLIDTMHIYTCYTAK